MQVNRRETPGYQILRGRSVTHGSRLRSNTDGGILRFRNSISNGRRLPAAQAAFSREYLRISDCGEEADRKKGYQMGHEIDGREYKRIEQPDS